MLEQFFARIFEKTLNDALAKQIAQLNAIHDDVRGLDDVLSDIQAQLDTLARPTDDVPEAPDDPAPEPVPSKLRAVKSAIHIRPQSLASTITIDLRGLFSHDTLSLYLDDKFTFLARGFPVAFPSAYTIPINALNDTIIITCICGDDRATVTLLVYAPDATGYQDAQFTNYKPINRPVEDMYDAGVRMAWLTRNDMPRARQWIDRGVPARRYLLLNEVRAVCGLDSKNVPVTGCGTVPHQNTYSYESGDIDTIVKNNWHLTTDDGYGVVVYNESPNGPDVRVTPHNPEFQQWAIRKILDSQHESGNYWASIGFDNWDVDGSRLLRQAGIHPKVDTSKPVFKRWPNLYDGSIHDDTFIADHFDMAKRFIVAIRADTHYALVGANVLGTAHNADMDTTSYTRWLDSALMLDFVLDEFWGRYHSATDGKFYSIEKTISHIRRAIEVQERGTQFLAMIRGSFDNVQSMDYSRALIAMASVGNFMYRYTTGAYSHWQPFRMWDVGQPFGAYTQNGNVLTREFTNGTVTLNLDTRTGTFKQQST